MDEKPRYKITQVGDTEFRVRTNHAGAEHLIATARRMGILETPKEDPEYQQLVRAWFGAGDMQESRAISSPVEESDTPTETKERPAVSFNSTFKNFLHLLLQRPFARNGRARPPTS